MKGKTQNRTLDRRAGCDKQDPEKCYGHQNTERNRSLMVDMSERQYEEQDATNRILKNVMAIS